MLNKDLSGATYATMIPIETPISEEKLLSVKLADSEIMEGSFALMTSCLAKL